MPALIFRSQRLSAPSIPRRLGSVIFCSGLLLAAGPLRASQITLSSSMLAAPSVRWSNQAEISRQYAYSLDSLAAGAVDALDGTLEMAAKGPFARAIFLGTAQQIATRIHIADSMMGHEYAHFQTAHGAGLTSHYFLDENGRRFDNSDAWMNSFLHGAPGGSAVSERTGGNIDPGAFQQRRALIDAAGINWQVDYSARQAKSIAFEDDVSAFELTSVFFNRAYPAAYILRSHSTPDAYAFTPDPVKYARLIDDRTGATNTIDKMEILSAASLALSPIASFMPISGLTAYVMTGKTRQSPPSWHRQGFDISWDLPYYLNEEGLSAAPVVYLLDKAPSNAQIEREMLGLSLELPVGAKFPSEIGVSFDWRTGSSDKSVEISASHKGAYLEASATYALSDRLDATMGFASKTGDSIKGARELPDSSTRFHVGISMSLGPKR